MSDAHRFHVSIDPIKVFERIRSEVPECYWFDVLNCLFIRRPFVGFLGVNQSTIWCNRCGRSANRPRLRIFVEPNRHGCRIDYRIDPPLLVGNLFGTVQEDEAPLRGLMEKLFADVRIEPAQ